MATSGHITECELGALSLQIDERGNMMTESKHSFIPSTPDFDNRVKLSFSRQPVMNLTGAELVKVVPGEVEIQIPFKIELTQQHGFLHAGIITAIVDNACGYAALSLMPADASVLTVEFKMNFLSPAKGETFVARGKVVKPGQTITVCSGEVFSINEGEQKLIAIMTATMMMLQDRPGVTPG